MNQITFDAKRIAEGYLNRPWLHKKVMEQFVKDCKITSNFQNGLDVGCGAGLSTKALRLICDRVTGTDISEQMIQSNVNIKLESGAVNEENARDWLEKSLTPVFENREKTLYFKGYNWYIYKLG